jgi:hypothetical protein
VAVGLTAKVILMQKAYLTPSLELSIFKSKREYLEKASLHIT